ncbi:uncharacterized protein BKA55DRAFT_544158 [Fusarium redolens]|uniref:Uncharacterized protein n=1 Tax=Fusarium redolens TaxID=48865 RepID=A0A9P9JRD9_FUSRE|nr:uncharacterized protein BKA55DRAFT_544158 [Fusarium redolens]KAH7234972.1 hypothetical protein BKA55DRAFT_544158 [Fusarium redolens]
MAAAIRKNFSSRGKSSLVRMVVFDCSLIELISRTDPGYLGGTISPAWIDRELSGLKKLEKALRHDWPLTAEEAAFLAAFTGSARYEEWLINVIIEAEWVLCILPIVRKRVG